MRALVMSDHAAREVDIGISAEVDVHCRVHREIYRTICLGRQRPRRGGSGGDRSNRTPSRARSVSVSGPDWGILPARSFLSSEKE